MSPAPRPVTIRVPVSVGELLDKIAILEIKAARIADPDKLANVRRELDALREAAGRLDAGPRAAEAEALRTELRAVNETLWGVEDALRACERQGDFGEAFVGLARAVYLNNDRRAGLKRALNRLFGSELMEEKSYHTY